LLRRAITLGFDIGHDLAGPKWRGLWHWNQIKVNGIYTFQSAKRPKVNPFITAGFSTGSCTEYWLSGYNAGAGVQYWFRDKVALRAEFLYQHLQLEKKSLFTGTRRIVECTPKVRQI
jgi:hypothetical protein